MKKKKNKNKGLTGRKRRAKRMTDRYGPLVGHEDLKKLNLCGWIREVRYDGEIYTGFCHQKEIQGLGGLCRSQELILRENCPVYLDWRKANEYRLEAEQQNRN